MIADKIIPSFYMIEAEGRAAESVINGPFGIKKIVIGSKDFDNDMDATAAMQQSVEFITNFLKPDWSAVTEKIDYNPEFFPSLPQTELTEEQKLKMVEAELQAESMQENLEDNQVAIVIAKVFDTIGDYVQSRWVLDGGDFKVISKVGVNPDRYLQNKVIDTLAANDKFVSRDVPSGVVIQ